MSQFENLQAQQQYQGAGQKQADAYDQHRQAVIEWQTACKEFAVASQRREQAMALLQKCTQVLSESVAAGMQDPTVPAPPVNGSALNQPPQRAEF